MWEAALVAGQKRHGLNNLVVLVDNNGWTAMGRTEDVADLEPLEYKWESFGFEVSRIPGHSYESIERAIARTSYSEKPSVIICDTIKGKGFNEFEDKILFHYAYVDKETYEQAMKSL